MPIPAFRIAKQGPAAWVMVLLLLSLFYGGVWMLYAGKFQTSGAGPKYDISAEVFKRILFTRDIEGIDAYVADVHGWGLDILHNGFSQTIRDERPLFFLFLAALKCFQPIPVGLNFLCGMVLLVGSLVLLAYAFDVPNKPLYVLLSGLLLSPYTVCQAFSFEPHVLQIFLPCVSVFFYTRQRFFWSFFFMVLSLFAHGANLVLIGCLGLYFLYDRRFDWRDYLRGALGGIAAWGAMELVLALLFWRDRLHVVPHVQFIVWLLTKSGRLTGQYAKGNGTFHFFKSAFILLPIGTVGLFWVKSRLQFALALLPVCIFAVSTRFDMPAELRVTLPFFFLGYAFFWRNLLESKTLLVRGVALCLVAFAAVLSGAYLVVAAQSLAIDTAPGTPVAVCQSAPGFEPAPDWLHCNLRRFHPVTATAPVSYCLQDGITRLDFTNIPDPNYIQANLVFRFLAMFLSRPQLEKLGSLTPTPPIPRLVKETAPHGG